MHRSYWFLLTHYQRLLLHTLRPIINKIILQDTIKPNSILGNWIIRVGCNNGNEIGQDRVSHECFILPADIECDYTPQQSNIQNKIGLHVCIGKVAILSENGYKTMPKSIGNFLQKVACDIVNKQKKKYKKTNIYSKECEQRMCCKRYLLYKLLEYFKIEAQFPPTVKQPNIPETKPQDFIHTPGSVTDNNWSKIIHSNINTLESFFEHHLEKIEYMGSRYTALCIGIYIIDTKDLVTASDLDKITVDITDRIEDELALAKSGHYLNYKYLIQHNPDLNDDKLHIPKECDWIENDTTWSEVRNYFTSCTFKPYYDPKTGKLLDYKLAKYFCYSEYLWSILSKLADAAKNLSWLHGGSRCRSNPLKFNYKQFLIETCDLASYLCDYIQNPDCNWHCKQTNFVALNAYHQPDVPNVSQGTGLDSHKDNFKTFDPTVSMIKFGTNGTRQKYGSNLPGHNALNLCFSIYLPSGMMCIFDS